MKNIEVVICHYGCSCLLKDTLKSLRKYYPELEPTIINDNKLHIGHGACLDKAFIKSDKDLILTMDNDIRLRRGGLLEEMLELLKDDVYAVGEAVGHEVTFIHPKLALWRRKPIVEHGYSFRDCLVYDRETKRTTEFQTGQLLGYQMVLKYNMKGEHISVLDYAHHLSEKNEL